MCDCTASCKTAALDGVPQEARSASGDAVEALHEAAADVIAAEPATAPRPPRLRVRGPWCTTRTGMPGDFFGGNDESGRCDAAIGWINPL